MPQIQRDCSWFRFTLASPIGNHNRPNCTGPNHPSCWGQAGKNGSFEKPTPAALSAYEEVDEVHAGMPWGCYLVLLLAVVFPTTEMYSSQVKKDFSHQQFHAGGRQTCFGDLWRVYEPVSTLHFLYVVVHFECRSGLWKKQTQNICVFSVFQRICWQMTLQSHQIYLARNCFSIWRVCGTR